MANAINVNNANTELMSTRNYKSTWRNSMNYQRYSNVTVNTATFRLTQKKLSQNMLGWAKWMGGSWSQHTRCQLNTSTLIHPAICKIHQESGPHITKYLFSALHKRICAIKLLFREPTNSTSPLPSYHPLASKAESLWYRIRAEVSVSWPTPQLQRRKTNQNIDEN